MRIYEGSPRQDWEGVLRAVGAYVDREHLRELLFLELDGGFLVQGLALREGGADAESFGSLAKRTYEITEEQVAELMDEGEKQRGSAPSTRPHFGYENFYELAMRVIGRYIDEQRCHDVFFFEQEGAFVLRLFGVTGSRGSGHQLAEFTKDEILAMIESAPELRTDAAE